LSYERESRGRSAESDITTFHSLSTSAFSLRPARYALSCLLGFEHRRAAAAAAAVVLAVEPVCYDAVQLASALIWKDSIGDEVTLATFDRELWHAAPRAGLRVWPKNSRMHDAIDRFPRAAAAAFLMFRRAADR
jgi:hypothetical protein